MLNLADISSQLVSTLKLTGPGILGLLPKLPFSLFKKKKSLEEQVKHTFAFSSCQGISNEFQSI